MKLKTILLFCLTVTTLLPSLAASRFISDQELWKHVVTIDRLAWQEREGVKKINKIVEDETFVRRIYLDITGKVPTYEQMLSFLKNKDINKREVLIEKLLDSPGYVSHFSNFWMDLLRTPYGDPEDFNHKEFSRYIERFLTENRPYDTIVYDMLTAKGSVQQNQAIGYYMRDEATDPMDTLNATVRAFLGTRIGCAQCHNHRFDKWTQKEFYESAAHLWGVNCGSNIGNSEQDVMGTHHKAYQKDKRFKNDLSSYANFLFRPSSAEVKFDASKKLTYPDNYVYDNAKPKAPVDERIVFDYGDSNVKGTDRREAFAKWLTSKSNPMFARIMTNRLWKRIMGVAIMEPIDDWKDNIIVQNPHLFTALGDVFASLNYDFKAFLSVIFNSEAYQLAYDTKNHFENEDYKVQGAVLKRMSSTQIADSLLTLQYGNLDPHSKLDPQYFEFEDKLNELVQNYKKDVMPIVNAHVKKHGRDTEEIDPRIIDIMFTYSDKLRELEQYYNIGQNGFLKSNAAAKVALATKSKSETSMMMMEEKEGSMKQDNGKAVMRANYKSGDFMNVFGALDRSAPETNVDTGATMKQILKMINSEECRNVAKKDSYLMTEMWKHEKTTERIAYLYYSIYGRAPTQKDVSIATNFFEKDDKPERWSKYTLALINSPEFYFIK